MTTRRFLKKTSKLLDEAEGKKREGHISQALGRAGLRTARVKREGGLASRFYNPHAPRIDHHPHAQDLGKSETPTVQAATCCPRCKQPNVIAKLSNGTSVRHCERGCRYTVPLPDSDLVTNN